MPGQHHEGLIVIGAPRSGTTLLRRLLDAHSGLACPGETNLLTAASRFLHSERIGESVPIDVLTGLKFMGVDEDVALDRLREFVFGFLQDYAAQQGKRRWAEKTAFSAFHLDNVERLCGDRVAWVLILRHGLDVVTSIHDLCEENGGYLSELHEYVKLHSRPLEAFAHAWVDLTNAILDFHERHAESSVLIKYEELTADPRKELERIFDLIGEPWEDGLVERALAGKTAVGLGDWKTYGKSQVDRGSVGRWKDLSPTTVHALARIVNPTLERCGYETVPTRDEPSAEEARRRYQIGVLLQGMRTPKK